MGGGDLGVEIAQRAGRAGVLEDEGAGVGGADGGRVGGGDVDEGEAEGAARVASTARVWGWRSAATATVLDLVRQAAWAMVMASAAAVASSSRLALAMGMPVRSQTMVW